MRDFPIDEGVRALEVDQREFGVEEAFFDEVLEGLFVSHLDEGEVEGAVGEVVEEVA